MEDANKPLTCTLCGELLAGKPWYALLSICSVQSSSDFSWQLCAQCYKPVQPAILGILQQNLRTGITDIKQQAARLRI